MFAKKKKSELKYFLYIRIFAHTHINIPLYVVETDLKEAQFS